MRDIDMASRKYRLEQEAERVARANSRGAIPPLVPVPRDLVKSAWDKIDSEQKAALESVYHAAEYIQHKDWKSWPTLHQCVMGLAWNGEEIRRQIRTMPFSQWNVIVRKPPHRYSPAIVVHLIDSKLSTMADSDEESQYVYSALREIRMALIAGNQHLKTCLEVKNSDASTNG